MRNLRITALLLSLLLVAAGTGTASALAAEEDFLYDPGTVSVIEMTLPPAGIAGLEDEPFEYQAGGTVTVTPTDGSPDGAGPPSKTFQNVEIKLKGKPLGSFEDLDHKAAFKLKFKKAEPFFGLRKLTLNNMTQDPSMIHESLAYTAFRAAGVPASRAGYAYVRLNGENFGLHLNLESLDTVSLPKIFGAPFDDEAQHLYEANEYGADFYPGKESRFEVDEGEDDTSDLTALIAAVDAAAADPLPPSLSDLVDLDEMTRMWAVEKYIGHWDGYAGEGIDGQEGFNPYRPNNYYLYSDLAGRFSMLPWGADQTWERRLEFDGQDGRLFDLCLEDGTCAGMFAAAVADALEEVGGLDLAAQAAATEAMLRPWQALEEAPRKPYGGAAIAAAVDDTCDFIRERPAEAAAWLDLSPPPSADGSGCPPPPLPPPPPPLPVPLTPPSTGAVLTPLRPSAATPAPSFRPLRVVKLADRVRLHFGAGLAGQALLLGRARIEGERRTVCRDEVRGAGTDTLTLVCRLSEAARQRLQRHALPILLRATFAPEVGAPVLFTRQVTLPGDRG